jgi:hypothetical protein
LVSVFDLTLDAVMYHDKREKEINAATWEMYKKYFSKAL